LRIDRAAKVAGALVVVAAGAGLARAPGLLGSPHGEVYGHAWHVWWHATALPAWASGTDQAVGATVWPVADPLPTFFASVLTRLSSLEVGYDAWILASVALAFAGGAVLARAADGAPLVGGLALALAPSFVGALTSGLTEDSAVGIAALAYAALLRGRPALAGLLLGVLVWCGPVLATYAAFGAVALGVAAIRRDRSALARLAGGAAVALLVAAPAIWLQRPMLGGATSRELLETCSAAWRQNPRGGADVLGMVVPGRLPEGDGLVHPGYLGLAVLLLAALGARHRLTWVALTAVVAALGVRVCVAGHAVGPNPFGAFFTLGGALHDPARGVSIAAVALSALAARGALRLGAVGRLAPVAVALDFLVASPAPYPLPVAPSAPSEIAAALGGLSAGPVLVVPAAGPGINFLRPLLDQRVHGRRVLVDPNRPGIVPKIAATPLGAWLDALGRDGPPAPRPTRFDLPPLVSVLVVHEPHVARVEALLGPPAVRRGDGSAWDLRARPGP
jgi:hypothetical protein